MTVNRADKTSNYTVMSNHHLRDNSLSLSAKGLMSIMLSLPDDWDFSINGLVAYTGEGITVVKNAVKQLENSGYIERIQRRGENGSFGKVEFTINEEPVSPLVEKPLAVKPPTEKPLAVNLIQLNTNNNQILNNKVNNNKYRQIEDYIGKPLSVLMIEKINEWKVTDDMVAFAVEIAKYKNVYTLPYVDAIISEWQDNCVENLPQAKQYQEQRAKSRKHWKGKPSAEEERLKAEAEAKRIAEVVARDYAELEEAFGPVPDVIEEE